MGFLQFHSPSSSSLSLGYSVLQFWPICFAFYGFRQLRFFSLVWLMRFSGFHQFSHWFSIFVNSPKHFKVFLEFSEEVALCSRAIRLSILKESLTSLLVLKRPLPLRHFLVTISSFSFSETCSNVIRTG